MKYEENKKPLEGRICNMATLVPGPISSDLLVRDNPVTEQSLNISHTLAYAYTHTQGSDLHWLACAIYVACRTPVPTVGKGTAEGNYVSLTRILRCSEQRYVRPCTYLNGPVCQTQIKPNPGLNSVFNGDYTLNVPLYSGLGLFCVQETGPKCILHHTVHNLL